MCCTRSCFLHIFVEICTSIAGAVIEAVDAVLDKRVRNAYCLVRPPGHHAEADRGRGFCLFNNVALAALHAMEARGLKRVAIVDYVCAFPLEKILT